MSGPELRWMFHATAMVADYDLAVQRLQRLAGLRVLEYGESTQPEVGRRGGMTWIGDNSMEIGQPIVPDGGAARFVARHGGGMHSVAVQVRNLEATMRHLESSGVRVAARPMPEICFSDPRDTDGVFFEWSSLELEVDPRFGGTVPRPQAEPLFDPARVAFVGAVVDDPLRSADRLSALLGTAVTFEDPGAGPDRPAAGVSLGDCTLALYALPGAADAKLWGRTYHRSRVHLLAVMLGDLAGAAASLAEAGVSLVRAGDGILVPDPRATGGVQIALVDGLLPGDPRQG
jgi:Glyoxalase/Bleomycin resistance protein/Dioxygenase superfamily